MPKYTGYITLTDISDGLGITTWSIFVYKRSDTTAPATAPETPTGGTFNYANRSVVPPVGWSNTIPGGTNVVYVSTVTISYTETIGNLTLSGWSTPLPYTQFLPNGAYYVYVNGVSTYVPNVYLATVYTRNTTGNTPTAPTGGRVRLGGIGQGSVVTAPTGWFVNIQSITPATQDPVWLTTAQIISVSDTPTYTPIWTTPNFLYQSTGQIGGVRLIRSGNKPATIPPPTTTEMASIFARSFPVFGDVVIITYADTSVALRWADTTWSVVTQLIDGSLVVNGSITADTLSTNSVTSDKITVNAVTADKIAVNSVTADKISVSNLSSINATTGTLTVGNSTNNGYVRSNNFVTGSAGFSLNQDGSAEFYNATVRGNIATNSLTAGSLTGNYVRINSDGGLAIQTGSTGARMTMSNNVIKIYDSTNQLRIQIGDLTA